MSKILILCTYYERPEMVKDALRSVLACDYYHPDWELAFLDDSSPTPGQPIAEEVLKPRIDKVKFYRTETQREEKIEKGSELGKILNQAMRESDADLCVSLNDDDRFALNYLKNLSDFMEERPGHLSCFSKVHLAFPSAKNRPDLKPLIALLTKHCPYNQWEGFIDPYLTVEWCQVAWRLPVIKQHDIWFDECCDANHDAFFFKRMTEKLGPCCGNTTFYSQWKTYHSRQATRRAFDPTGRWGSDPTVLYSDAEGLDDDIEIVIQEAIAQSKFWLNHNRTEIARILLSEVLSISDNPHPQAKLLLDTLDQQSHFQEVKQYVDTLKKIGDSK